MRGRSSSRFSRLISAAWSVGDGISDRPEGAPLKRAAPPQITARQFRNIDDEIPPLPSQSASAVDQAARLRPVLKAVGSAIVAGPILVTALVTTSYAEAVCAHLVSAAAFVALGLSGCFERLIELVPYGVSRQAAARAPIRCWST
ncbi:hypothetical protein ASE02_21360 [Phenylobacterium sp. Root700]|nr:hypothetical protein ASE02_21360 [Phenylobacterium sp. Root700]